MTLFPNGLSLFMTMQQTSSRQAIAEQLAIGTSSHVTVAVL